MSFVNRGWRGGMSLCIGGGGGGDGGVRSGGWDLESEENHFDVKKMYSTVQEHPTEPLDW